MILSAVERRDLAKLRKNQAEVKRVAALRLEKELADIEAMIRKVRGR